MARKRRHPPLSVYLNDRLVGMLEKQPNGAISFVYDENWLGVAGAIPVSLSLPLREQKFTGANVSAFFDNLLPDAEPLRRRVAERVGADGTGAYDLLSQIGRDCVGALQFVPQGVEPTPSTRIDAEAVDNNQIADIIGDLGRSPLGLQGDGAFRISIAGAQEKTALLLHEGRWHLPHGTTPTTHIIKPAIGMLPNGIDLSDSVENEWYCMTLLREAGLPVANAGIVRFEETRALVIERFDRRLTKAGTILRLPQEDCCQALGVPSTRKYESEGGPGAREISDLLLGSDEPAGDRNLLYSALSIFWLIGATDGHAKNFSLFLRPGGSFSLTPLYDVLTVQPTVDAGGIDRRNFRLSMAMGDRRHYRMDKILGRHIVQTGTQLGLSEKAAKLGLQASFEALQKGLEVTAADLPADFPPQIHESVVGAVSARSRSIPD